MCQRIRVNGQAVSIAGLIAEPTARSRGASRCPFGTNCHRHKVHFMPSILDRVACKATVQKPQRSGVVRTFPSVDSPLRLVNEYEIEFPDDRARIRAEVHPESTQYQGAERTSTACYLLLHGG
jgi:hypothetical protein